MTLQSVLMTLIMLPNPKASPHLTLSLHKDRLFRDTRYDIWNPCHFRLVKISKILRRSRRCFLLSPKRPGRFNNGRPQYLWASPRMLLFHECAYPATGLWFGRSINSIRNPHTTVLTDSDDNPFLRHFDVLMLIWRNSGLYQQYDGQFCEVSFDTKIAY